MIKAFGTNILIEPIKKETEFITEGIMTTKCKVIDCGEDVKWVKVGDTIIANYYGTDEVEVDGQKLFFVIEHPDFIKGKYVPE